MQAVYPPNKQATYTATSTQHARLAAAGSAALCLLQQAPMLPAAAWYCLLHPRAAASLL